ncbi:3-oxoacyl-ACP synthase [Candidatus Peregrinibacteria bacterium]|nr:3-oxoacyl-ACP synthase [Candidatus Peregrinibacteria bacterium]
MKNEDIDTSDDPVMSDAFWEGAELIYPDKKTQRVSIRVKPKVVDWFKKNYKKGHQTQMHNVLESYVESKMAHCK